jgi:glycosyltransferase involved in cell wall biosynthesis
VAICTKALEGRLPNESNFATGDYVKIGDDLKWICEIGADVYYNPLCEELPDVGEMPVLILHADVLHRDVAGALPATEVERREIFFRQNCRRANRIQTISKFSQGRIESCFPDAMGKVFCTHLPVQNRLKNGSEVGGASIEEPYVFYPANFWPHKNHRFLVEIFRHYVGEDVTRVGKLVFTGNPDKEAHLLMNEVKEMGLEERILFAGHLSERDFSRLFEKARALVFPSTYEGFGIPPLEAMSLGVPVLSSDAGSLPEIVRDGGCILPVNDHNRWNEALVRIFNDDEWREGLIESGKRVVGLYSIHAEASVLLSELRKLIGSDLP